MQVTFAILSIKSLIVNLMLVSSIISLQTTGPGFESLVKQSLFMCVEGTKIICVFC